VPEPAHASGDATHPVKRHPLSEPDPRVASLLVRGLGIYRWLRI